MVVAAVGTVAVRWCNEELKMGVAVLLFWAIGSILGSVKGL